MTGAGNDFVLIDERKESSGIDWASAAPRLCDRRNGIGADGLLVLRPSQRSGFLMLYFNADGSSGGMCGNGGRCAAAFVLAGSGEAHVAFEAVGRLYRATVGKGEIVHLEMTDPTSFDTGTLEEAGEAIPYHFVDSGTAHAVILLDEAAPSLRAAIAAHGVTAAGRAVRNSPRFAPGGTNVDFVGVVDKKTITMRTYERGVEDETLACGTGAVASAVIAALERGVVPPVDVKTHGGSTLRVAFRIEGRKVSGVTLSGPVAFVYRGEAGEGLLDG